MVRRRIVQGLAALTSIALSPALAHPFSAPAFARAPAQAACLFDSLMLSTSAAVCRPRARSYPAAVQGTVKRAIYDGSLAFGMPYTVLLKIARCESALNPKASNGTHFGLFQFAPATFRRGAARMRAATGIEARTYWNALDSAYVAGYLFVTGGSTAWSCEPAHTPPA